MEKNAYYSLKIIKKINMNYIDLLLLHQCYNEYIKKGSKAIGYLIFGQID